MRSSTSSTDGFGAESAPCETGSTWLNALLRRPVRHLLTRMLRAVRCGSIQIEMPDGQRLIRRGSAPGPQASIAIHRWRTLVRLMLRGDIGLAESYRDGDWSSADLPALLEFGIRNEPGSGDMFSASWPVRWLYRALHVARANTRRGSRNNIAFHYDLGNDFYAQWLDPELIYSSALYTSDAQSLEEAQAVKMKRVIELLRLDQLPDDASVLEIGCGWGALAIAAAPAIASRPAARFVGLTLSAEQLAHAQRRVAQELAGAAKQIDLRLQDYRDVDGLYDRIVSIEMLEAVGERYWPKYFETLRRRLRPSGTAVVQVITIADEHFDHYKRGADFIQRFIFPGGMLPSVSAMRKAAAHAGLEMHTQASFGDSYAATLVEWRRRFLRAWPTIELMGFDSRFRRLWEYYLCYCEAGFRAGRVDVGLYTFKAP